ncbi:MAG: asparaginase [Acidobacteriota bacterium]|nr:MAG: asparaginase [Acidobacteriota bacterium]
MSDCVPLVEVRRDGQLESLHRGIVVVADASGLNHRVWGDPRQHVILRSAGKPFQAAQLIAGGAADALGLTDRELAVAIGSHGGAPEHVQVVRSLMEKSEVDARMLKCGIHPPFDRAARTLSRHKGATVLQNNCSGKHAAMLAGAIFLGQPIETYLHPSHPWQRAIHKLLAVAAGVDEQNIATVTDGCGAPSFVLPAEAAARAYAALAAADDGPLARVWSAATGHPRMMAGEGRLETDLMEAWPGRLLTKSGAEGVYAIAARTDAGPRGALLKIADGDDRRARTAAALGVVAQLLELAPEALEPLRQRYLPAITTLTGRPVGKIVTLLS